MPTLESRSMLQHPTDGLGSSVPLRRSPRKRGSEPSASSENAANRVSSTVTGNSRDAQSKVSPPKPSRGRDASGRKHPHALKEISLPPTQDESEFETAITSAQRARSYRKPSDIDTVALSLSEMTVSEEAKGSRTSLHTKTKASLHYTSRYVLKEADCIDDYSDVNEDEDEDTDLSGFVVDDDAELSYHISSGEDSEDEYVRKTQPRKQPRRRLQRGHRRVVDSDSDSDKENDSDGQIADTLQELDIENKSGVKGNTKTHEVIDLTWSPEAPSRKPSTTHEHDPEDPFTGTSQGLTKSTKTLSLFESIMRLSPPRKASISTSFHVGTPEPSSPPACNDSSTQQNRPQTPTETPSPPRLKSPSKLLSPSKRATAQRSPHRQSTDAFWDHHTVNDWYDTYSPKKAPLKSPAKDPLSRFAIWSDDEASNSDSGHDVSSSDSIPSPCASPSKPRSSSPMKSPEKAARAAYLAEKRAANARKKAFDATKDKLATDLMSYLDDHVTWGQLHKLSASTGGVQIQWSKTLRSTAGRANWRRSVTKPSGSPIKGSPVKGMVGGQKVKVEHFANIELADKVIDCEERLVNTLAHEFCHLANFMVSNVRDQPHGASFKAWAAKATACLAAAEEDEDERVRPSWRDCQVTTKHSYEIEWKYLWTCAGREQSKAMSFLNVPASEGCGAEYGRHSKSIDTERMRCGRCKGKLVQVRPVPRATKKTEVGSKEQKGKKARKTSGSGSGSESVSGASDGAGVAQTLKGIEVIDLSD